MRSKWISFMVGYVEIELRGEQFETLLNEMLKANIAYWNASRLADGNMRMHVHLGDFFRLRTLLKQTGCRSRVIRRYGAPFKLKRLLRRKFFVAGIVGFFVGLYLLSSIVWQVNVTGNENIPTEDILQAAKREGMYSMQWKARLKDPDALSKALMREIPGVSWVGVDIQGTKIQIRVVESKLADKQELMSPRDIIADSDAVITEILAETGRAVVKENTRVKKGDILITGVLGDEENQEIVVAKGTVKGLVWHEYDIQVPLVQKHKVYTGESKDRFYLTFGDRALKVTGYGKTGYNKKETSSSRSVLQWRSWKLPFGWMSEKVREVNYEQRKLSKEEAKKVGLEQARIDLLAKLGPEASIEEQKLLHETVQNGKVYMKVLFTTEEDITQESPIIRENPTQGD